MLGFLVVITQRFITNWDQLKQANHHHDYNNKISLQQLKNNVMSVIDNVIKDSSRSVVDYSVVLC